jgi:NDP-sugar pyrophosphorylase family protein
MVQATGGRPAEQGLAVPRVIGSGGSTLIVPSGDIVANFGRELLEEARFIHKRAGAALTMVLTEIPLERRGDFGTVLLKKAETRPGKLSLSGRVCGFFEKDPKSPSCLNNASIYIIETDFVRMLDRYRTEADPSLKEPFYDFGKHVFPAMTGRLPYINFPEDYRLWGIEFRGAWFDVGTKCDYLSVNRSVLDGLIDVPIPYRACSWGYIGEDVSLDEERVTVVPPVLVGNGCKIEHGAVLGPYAVIGDGWLVRRGAEISNSVLWEKYPYYWTGKRACVEAGEPEVQSHVKVRNSIVAAPCVAEDVISQTLDLRQDGTSELMPIEYVPAGPRP